MPFYIKGWTACRWGARKQPGCGIVKRNYWLLTFQSRDGSRHLSRKYIQNSFQIKDMHEQTSPAGRTGTGSRGRSEARKLQVLHCIQNTHLTWGGTLILISVVCSDNWKLEFEYPQLVVLGNSGRKVWEICSACQGIKAVMSHVGVSYVEHFSFLSWCPEHLKKLQWWPWCPLHFSPCSLS